MKVLGIDIGGTKCAVILGEFADNRMQILKKSVCATDHTVSPNEMIMRLCSMADKLTDNTEIDAIGISCGGPLDSQKGIILSPPNLPGWDYVPICEIIKQRYKVDVKLQNDANACAVAEWKFGAGKGSSNMVFLTFGTGLGAGLILNGQLYSGTNGNAGEVGHIRLSDNGPVGYGKSGSFEGFCSGGGLAQLGYSMALESIQTGKIPLYCNDCADISKIDAKSIALAANAGDTTALKVFEFCGRYLGKGISMLIDILNPEKIVIGSIYARQEQLLVKYMQQSINEEALSASAACCCVVPAALGEQIGDYAALGVALL